MSWRATVLFGIAFLLAAGSLQAQSLGELAEREKKRREQLQEEEARETLSFTDEDLEGDRPAGPSEAAPADSGRRGRAPARSRDEDGGDSEGDEEDEDEGADSESGGRPSGVPGEGSNQLGPRSKEAGEQAWRRRADELRELVAERRKLLQQAEAKAKAEVRGPNVVQRTTNDMSQDPDNLLTENPTNEKLREEVLDSREDLEYAEGVLARFLEEARRKGVPPGWVR